MECFCGMNEELNKSPLLYPRSYMLKVLFLGKAMERQKEMSNYKVLVNMKNYLASASTTASTTATAIATRTGKSATSS